MTYRKMLLLLLQVFYFSLLCKAQTDESKRYFREELDRGKIAFRMPKGFKEIDTPKVITFIDSANINNLAKGNGVHVIDEWDNRLKCKNYPSPIGYFTIINAKRNIVISYTVFVLKNTKQFNSEYSLRAREEKRKLKADPGFIPVDSVVLIYPDEYVKRTYNADEGLTRLNIRCNCLLRQFYWFKSVVLGKAPGPENNFDYAYVNIIYRYTDEDKDNIDDIIKETASSIRFN